MAFNVCQWIQVPATAAQSFAVTMPAFAPGVAAPLDGFVWALQRQTEPCEIRHPFLLPSGGERYYSGLLARIKSDKLILGIAAYLGGGHEAIAHLVEQSFGTPDRFLWGGELFCRAGGSGQGVALKINETSGFLKKKRNDFPPQWIDDLQSLSYILGISDSDEGKKGALLKYPDEYDRLLKMRAKVKSADPGLAGKLDSLISLEELRALEGDGLASALAAMDETAGFLRGQLRAPVDAFKWVSPNGLAEIRNALTGTACHLPFPVDAGAEYVPFSLDAPHLDERLNKLAQGKNLRHEVIDLLCIIALMLERSDCSSVKEGIASLPGEYDLCRLLRSIFERDDPDLIGKLDGIIPIDTLTALDGEKFYDARRSLRQSIETVSRQFQILDSIGGDYNFVGIYHLFDLSLPRPE